MGAGILTPLRVPRELTQEQEVERLRRQQRELMMQQLEQVRAHVCALCVCVNVCMCVCENVCVEGGVYMYITTLQSEYMYRYNAI